MTNKVRALAEHHHVRGVGRSGGCLPRGDAMSRYSLAKVDNEYVVQVEGQSVLRLSSRRQAAKLISALNEREESHATGGYSHQRWRKPQPPDPKRGPQ